MDHANAIILTIPRRIRMPVSLVASLLLAAIAPRASCQDATASWPAGANYPNNRDPLLKTKFVKLPLGAVQPAGWLRDELKVQANGLSGHVHEVWDVIKTSAWKGDLGKNVTPECCTARFVPRWMEGMTVLGGVLGDTRFKSLTDPYMRYIFTVQDPATVTPSVCAWSHLGRFLPEYYELTGDARAIKLARKILDYADSVRDSKDSVTMAPGRLGMLLEFGLWYYNQTGDPDVPDLLERCTKTCVKDWEIYFTHFPEAEDRPPHDLPASWSHQGVDVTQSIQYPILYYLLSRNQCDKDSVAQGISNLDKGYGQVCGRWNADEWLANTDPTQGTELCDVEELLHCMENGFKALGEPAYADRMEQLIFNAFPGTCTADMWAHQYDQQANQVLVSVARRHWHDNDDTANIYGFTPNFPCCLANMHSPFPRYIESMWMATADNGLVAVAYGPCRVKARAAQGLPVEIAEETGYPFSSRIRFTIHSKQPASFPIYFRIPSWADQAALSVPNETDTRHPEKGTLFKVERLWKSGDVVTLDFNSKVRTETRRNNSVAVAWGPLYFVLRVGEAFSQINEAGTPPGCVDWRIAPTTDWNYALAIDRLNPECVMITNKISSMPFAQKGEPVKRPGATTFAPWQEDVPLVLKVKARLLHLWGMDGANAAAVPLSPVKSSSRDVLVELIPYGCSRLRISEFPTVQPGEKSK
jgi:hypothetical protein